MTVRELIQALMNAPCMEEDVRLRIGPPEDEDKSEDGVQEYEISAVYRRRGEMSHVAICGTDEVTEY